MCVHLYALEQLAARYDDKAQCILLKYHTPLSHPHVASILCSTMLVHMHEEK